MSAGADWTSTGKLFQSHRQAAAKRTIADSNKSRLMDVKETGGRRAQPASTVDTANRRRTEAGPIGTEVQCREELVTQ